ncbi:prepilin peptidase [Candidatus Gracilibacteria bacterium]|nr:MAG: prepilin peptidase [Candidatus Gracilibacteria bacterium]
METLFYIFLFIFGTLFGSFASVLIYRLKSGEKGIFLGRSHCKTCNRTLSALELIPIFSWLFSLGKCRGCKQKISIIYPLLEVSTGLVFMFVGVFLVDFEKIFLLNALEIGKLFFWIFVSFITILYIFYDLLFTEIHEGIMVVGIFTAFTGLFLNNFWKINALVLGKQNLAFIEIFSSLALGMLILGFLYIIMLKGLKEIYDAGILIFIGFLLFFYKTTFPETNFSENAILSGIIGAYAIFIFFFLQIVLSGGRALGGGDLRIGIMIGLILGINYSFIGIFLGYLVGSVIGIGILIKSKKSGKSTEVPFGPFLGTGFFLTIFFSTSILEIIRNYFFLL